MATTPDGTIVQASPATVLVFASGRQYTISGGVIYKNGAPDARTRNVIAIGKLGTTLYQVNTLGNYYTMADAAGAAATAGTWIGGGSTPIGPFVGVVPPPTVQPVLPPTTRSGIAVSNSIIYLNGKPWYGRGVDVAPWNRPVYANAPGNLLASFPGISLYGIYLFNDEGYAVDTNLFPIIDALTAAGVMVMLHSCNSGFTHNVPRGGDLVNQGNALAGYAAHYKNNSLVGYVTSNEPADAGNYGAVMAEWAAVIAAIRGTGNMNLIGLSVPNPGDAFTPSVVAGQKNLFLEQHLYPWEGQGQQGYNYITTFQPLSSMVSQDGVLPIIIGECGPSTSGGDPLDGPWLPAQLMGLAPHTNIGSGCVVNGVSWWGVATIGDQDQVYPNNGTSGGLSPYGAQLAAWLAGRPIPASRMPMVARMAPYGGIHGGASTHGGLRWKALQAK